MHPLIRIVCFLILGVAVTAGEPGALVLGLVLLIAAYGFSADASWRMTGRLLHALRWLFISILGVYLWFTPGTAAMPALGAWSPTTEGLALGAQRILALGLLAAGAGLLLQTTPRAALIPALLMLLSPLKRVGLPEERLALRIALTLEAVAEVQALLRAALDGMRQAAGGPVDRSAAALAIAFRSALEGAVRSPPLAVELPPVNLPAAAEWFYPIGLVAGFALAAYGI